MPAIYEVDGLEMIGSTRVRPSPSKYPSIVIDDDEPNEKSASLSQLKIEESVDISDVSSKKLRSDVITESIVIDDSDDERVCFCKIFYFVFLVVFLKGLPQNMKSWKNLEF